MNGQSGVNTRIVRAGSGVDPRTGAVNIPVYLAATYKMDELGATRAGYDYARSGNPSRAQVEEIIAQLEGGCAGFAFSSGTAAIVTVLSMFKSGDRVLVTRNVYGGTYRLLESVFSGFGITYTMADMGSRAALLSAIEPDVRAILIETPSNPLMDVTDLALVASVAREKGVLTIVDNTFMTPYLQKPLLLGADVSLHSATKYLGGHNDLVAGLVAVRTPELAQRIGFLQNTQGAVLPPFDSFLLARGIRTLGVRMDRHCENADFLARRLREAPGVGALYFPGLTDHPGHGIQVRQANTGGAMLSFELAGGYDLGAFFRALKLVYLAESLGGVESLICHPATMTHAAIPPEERARMGISDRLIRLSVGIEDAEDIFTDLAQALAAARA